MIGRFTPRRRERGPDGKVTRPPAGEAVKGYFPPIVDAEIWERVKGMTSGRSAYAPKGTAMANMLAGLAVCPKCGSTMTRVNKGSKQRPYLVCIKAKTGDGCEYRATPCHRIEDAVARKAMEFAMTMPSPDETLEAEWQRLLNEEEGHDAAISDTIDAIKAAGHSPALISTLQQLEADGQEIRRKLVEVGERVTASLTNKVQNTVEKLVEGLEAEPRDVPAITRRCASCSRR